MDLCPKCNLIEKNKNGYCKNCYNTYQKKYYHNIQKIKIKLEIKEKECRKCKIVQKIEEFSRSGVSIDGHQHVCKNCDHIRQGCHRRFKPPIILLNNEQRAYFAGLLDGEGYVGLVKAKRGKNSKYAGSYSYCAKITIAVTHPVLHEIQKEYNFGSIHVSKKRKLHHKDCIHWYMSSNVIRSILPQVNMFLRIKKEQARLVLEYLDAVKKRDKTIEYKNKIDNIHMELNKLNKRGKAKSKE